MSLQTLTTCCSFAKPKSAFPCRKIRVPRQQVRRCRGFSLVELLVLVGIVTVLMSLLLPAVFAAREAARRVDCQNRMRQIGVALFLYEGARARLPSSRNQGFLHWHFEILPGLEQQSLFEEISNELQSGVKWYLVSARATPLAVYECPSSPSSGFLHTGLKRRDVFGATHYVGIAGQSYETIDGVFPSWKTRRAFYQGTALSDITDGLSNTLAVGERQPNFEPLLGAWLSSQEYGHETLGIRELGGLDYQTHRSCPSSAFGPGRMDDYCSQFHHWSMHPSGANFSFADGHVQFLPYTTDQQLLVSMSTIGGQEVVPD